MTAKSWTNGFTLNGGRMLIFHARGDEFESKCRWIFFYLVSQSVLKAVAVIEAL